MLDPDLKDGLEFMAESIEIIGRRFSPIEAPDDFLASDMGQTILDAIAMRLQAIGEKTKAIEDKYEGFWAGNSINPTPIIRFRDFISHHYDELNPYVIFDICQDDLPELKTKLAKILASE